MVEKNRKAFTLIEMLISIVLMTLIVATMMFAFKYSINEFKRVGSLVPHKVLKYHQLASLINGMFPYVIEVQRGFEKKKYEPYIYPKEKSLEFISKNPIYSDKISISKLECSDKGLKYYEKLLYSKDSNYLAPKIEESDFKDIFYKDIESCKFSYNFNSSRNNPTLITLTTSKNSKIKEYIFAPMVDINNTLLILRLNTKMF